MQKRWRTILTLTLTTFALSIVFNLGSNSVLSFLPVTLSFVLLLFIILIGVLFDIVGVSAAAGEETPFHAMASNRVPGAQHSLWLVRNADRVATFCSDVIGDIAATLAGAIGIAIVIQLIDYSAGLGEALANTLMIAAIASLTVGGKAIGKNFAISRSTTILLLVGRVLHSLERIGITFGSMTRRGKKR